MNSQTYISLAEGLRRVATAEARRYFPDEDDVEDMAQEVMLRTWEKHLVLKPDERMLLAYVATLTRNLCKDKLKVKRRHPVLRLLWRTKEDEEETYILPSCDTPQS
ncbi:MAG: RNA polymerase sigma factor [Bacteroidaceae bacterium]